MRNTQVGFGGQESESEQVTVRQRMLKIADLVLALLTWLVTYRNQRRCHVRSASLPCARSVLLQPDTLPERSARRSGLIHVISQCRAALHAAAHKGNGPDCRPFSVPYTDNLTPLGITKRNLRRGITGQSMQRSSLRFFFWRTM